MLLCAHNLACCGWTFTDRCLSASITAHEEDRIRPDHMAFGPTSLFKLAGSASVTVRALDDGKPRVQANA